MWTLATLTAGAGALAIERNDRDERSATASALPRSAPTTTTTTTTPPSLPAPDQARVSGVVGRVEVTGRVAETVPLPLTFTSAERGAGNGGEIAGVLVGTDRAAIVWDAGRALVVDGDGGFAFGLATIALLDGALHARIGGSPVAITPGAFAVDTPVAVGRGGLAEPRDQVDFVVAAGDSPTVEFRGDVSVVLPLAPTRVTGSGGLVLEGSFTIEAPDGTQSLVSRVVVDPDRSFDIALAPFEGGWIVDGQVPRHAKAE